MEMKGSIGIDVREGRLAAFVIVVTTLVWLSVQYFGEKLGLELRYAVLADLAAMAAYIFALAQVWRIWRRGSDQGGSGQTSGRPGN
jgi:hypothetical protein